MHMENNNESADIDGAVSTKPGRVITSLIESVQKAKKTEKTKQRTTEEASASKTGTRL